MHAPGTYCRCNTVDLSLLATLLQHTFLQRYRRFSFAAYCTAISWMDARHHVVFCGQRLVCTTHTWTLVSSLRIFAVDPLATFVGAGSCIGREARLFRYVIRLSLSTTYSCCEAFTELFPIHLEVGIYLIYTRNGCRCTYLGSCCDLLKLRWPAWAISNLSTYLSM